MIRFALTGPQAGSHTYDIPRTRVSFSDRHHCFGSGWPLQVLESRTEPLNPATWLTRDTRVFVCFHISSLSSSTHGQFIDSARINFFKSNCDVFRVSTPSTPWFLEERWNAKVLRDEQHQWDDISSSAATGQWALLNWDHPWTLMPAARIENCWYVPL